MIKSIKDLANIPAYQAEYEEELKDLNGTGIILTHKKSGARISLVSNEDENKVFYIGFRTPPFDSTGVAHIVEHTVLCGSKNFSAKDPFNELLKGSLNTFLNAMTYPDKTVYPVASCNDKDFQNLIHVYMDAVLYPNIYVREEIFKQEGWHYELQSPDAPLEMNGIVYSEMKGAFSQAEQKLAREVFNTLFPDTAYGVESGGDPDVIPDLTYQEFLDFHKRYYHPANSYIYLYGNCDMLEKLNWLDKEYLSKFDKITVESEVAMQKELGKKELEMFYPIGEDEDSENKTYYSYNTIIGDSLDVKQCMAIEILDEVLVSAPGAPLKQELLDRGLGEDVFTFTDTGVLQPFFSLIVKDAKAGKKEEFINTIKDTLSDIVNKGLNEKSLQAAINKAEFKYREADYGRIPKGLMTGLVMMNSWLYNDEKAFSYLHGNKYYEELKKEIKTGYYENIIKEYLINPNHMTVLTLSPKKGLTAEKEAELAKKLDDFKQSLSKEEIDALIEDTKHLKKYQEEPSSKEDIEKIPLLSREDINKEAHKLYIDETDISNIPSVLHKINTNGIAYIKCIFDLSSIPQDMIPYIGLFTSVFGYVNTNKHSFLELSNEVNIHTGGINSSVNIINRNNTDDYLPVFIVNASVLYSELNTFTTLLNEMIHESVIEDTKRLYEIISEVKSRLQMALASSANFAADRATSYHSQSAYYNELLKGIEYFKFVCGLSSDFEGKKQEIVNNLIKVSEYIFAKGNLLISITAEDENCNQVMNAIVPFIDMLSDKGNNNFIEAKKCGSAAAWKNCDYKFKLEQKNEGFYYPGQVQYVARTGNYIKDGFKTTGALKVLRSILSREYLWNNVRVKGGAYGCLCGVGSIDGSAYFSSYRDPNLRETNQVYENMADYVTSFDADERDMTKYIIGTMSTVDAPLTPKMDGSRSLNAFLSSITMEDIQKDRDELLSTTKDTIRSLSGIINSIMAQNNLCVIGNETKLKDNKDMFNELKSLF